MTGAFGSILMALGAASFIISIIYHMLLPGVSDPTKAMYEILRYQNTGIGFIAFGGTLLIIYFVRRYGDEIKAKLDKTDS